MSFSISGDYNPATDDISLQADDSITDEDSLPQFNKVCYLTISSVCFGVFIHVCVFSICVLIMSYHLCRVLPVTVTWC